MVKTFPVKKRKLIHILTIKTQNIITLIGISSYDINNEHYEF